MHDLFSHVAVHSSHWQPAWHHMPSQHAKATPPSRDTLHSELNPCCSPIRAWSAHEVLSGCLRNPGKTSSSQSPIPTCAVVISTVVSSVHVRLSNAGACHRRPGTRQCIYPCTQPACLISSTQATYAQARATLHCCRESATNPHFQANWICRSRAEGPLPPSLHAPSSTHACMRPARARIAPCLPSYRPTCLPCYAAAINTTET